MDPIPGIEALGVYQGLGRGQGWPLSKPSLSYILLGPTDICF